MERRFVHMFGASLRIRLMFSKNIQCVKCFYNQRTFSNSNTLKSIYFKKHMGETVNYTSPIILGASLLTILEHYFGIAPDDDDEDTLITIIKKAIFALNEGSYDLSEQILHVALKIAQERLDYKAQTYIFDVMANLAYEREEYEKAEILFKDVLQRILSQGTPQDDVSVIHICMRLAEIYGKTNRDELAEHGYEFCFNKIKINLDKLGEEGIDKENNCMLHAKILDSYAKYLISRGRHVQAITYAEKAVLLSKENAGADNAQTLVLTNDLASIYGDTGELDVALPILEEVVRIARQIDHPDLPVFILNLGMMNANKKYYDISTKLCMEVYRLASKIGNEDLEKRSRKCLNLEFKKD